MKKIYSQMYPFELVCYTHLQNQQNLHITHLEGLVGMFTTFLLLLALPTHPGPQGRSTSAPHLGHSKIVDSDRRAITQY